MNSDAIRVKFRDGTEQLFTQLSHVRAALRYERGFAVIREDNGDETSFPAENIIEIKKGHDR